jgi:hypothetical protein
MMSRTRGEHCLSDLRLDELLAGGADVDGTAHLGACARCAARRDALAAEREALRPALPPLRAPRPRAPFALGAAAALAAALAAAIWVRDDGGTRLKGGARLAVVVTRAGVSSLAAPGERVRPGDTLTFLVSAPAAAFVAVRGRDGAGHDAVHVPPTAITAGRDLELPIAVVLDGVLGREELTAIFCPSEEAARSPAADGCERDHVVLEKVP